MVRHLALFCLIILVSVSCSKESATNNNSSGNAGTGGSLARFTIAGNYLYIVSGRDLNVFDISKPVPVSKSSIPLEGNAETIFPRGTL